MQWLAQTYQTTTSSSGGGVGLVFWLIYLAIVGVLIAGSWKMFTKAGKPGWAAIVPIYNTYVMLQIADRPTWWLILMFVPVVNFVVALLVALDIARKFGRSDVFGIVVCGLLGIGFAIIGFSGDTYQGGTATAGVPAAAPPTPPQSPSAPQPPQAPPAA